MIGRSMMLSTRRRPGKSRRASSQARGVPSTREMMAARPLVYMLSQMAPRTSLSAAASSMDWAEGAAIIWTRGAATNRRITAPAQKARLWNGSMRIMLTWTGPETF